MKNLTKKQKGILFIILAAMFFALMNCFVRLSGDLPTVQKSFFRNLVAVFVAFVVLMRSGVGFSYRLEDMPLLLTRSIMGTMGILGNFYAVDHLNIADASMLNKLSPFFAVIFSIFILKEKPKVFQVLGVIIAFAGSLFIIKSSMDFSHTVPAVVGMIGGLGAGVAYTCVRALGNKGVKGPLIVFFFSAFSCIVVLPYLVFNYHHMEWWQLGSLLLAGLAAAGGQFSITAAYTNAPAKEISVYDYSQVIFAAILGFFFFAQIPDIYSVIGYIIICGISIIMFIYNGKEDEKENA